MMGAGRLCVGLGVVGIVAAALTPIAREAFAHALLLESAPKHETVAAAPARLVLRFNGRIEKRLSRVVVAGGSEQRTIALDVPESSSPDTLVYPLPPLTPGPWEARWRVLSVDGHFTEGKVRFTVREP
jgi:methionine-rich copper-binding protein CopC